MKTWTCLFLGGPLDGQYVTCGRWQPYAVRTTRVVSWDARWTYLESYPEITQPEIYTPRQFRTNGWKIPLVFYVHQSLNVVTPRIPLGTVLPGAVWGEQNEHELVCRVCYGRPIAGYPFCNRTTAGVMHGRVAAELHLLDQL